MRVHRKFRDGILYDFSGGLNTKNTPLTLGKKDVAKAENVNLSREGGLEKREGYTKIISGASDVLSLYSKRLNSTDTTGTVYAVLANGDLVYNVPSIGSVGAWTTLSTSAFTERVWFAELFGAIYVGNGTDDNKRIEGTNVYNVGIQAPSTVPTASTYHFSVTGENIGTGDGSTTSFSHTTDNTPVTPSTVTIYYTISSTDYTATDDGSGNISGTDLTGTIDYTTGEVSLTFSTAPDSGTDITMDYDYGANLYGTYKYKVTFMRQGTPPVESNPSDEVEITVNGDAVQLTNIPTSSDPQVNARAIYRTTADGGSFMLIHIINDNTTTSWIDTLVDENLSTALDENRDPFPKAKYLTALEGRLWGVTDEGVVYSNFLRPDEWNQLNILKFPEDRGEITGLGITQGNLVVFKENSIYLVNPSTDPPIIRKLSSQVGCSLPDTIVNVGGGIFFADNNDIYYLRGTSLVTISDKIQNNWRELYDLSTAKAFYYPSKNQYIISIKTTSGTPYWLVFDLKHQAWTTYKIKYASASAQFLYDSTKEKIIFTDGDDVYMFGYGWTDDGNSYTVEIETRWETMGNPFIRKRLRRVYPIVYAEGEGTGTIYIGRSFHEGRSYSFNFLPAATWGSVTWSNFIWGFLGINDIRVDVNEHGTAFNFKITIEQDFYFNIIGIGYRFQEVGFEKVNPSI